MLAADAESQIASFGSAHSDELGLDFDDGYRLVPTLIADGVVFADDAIAALGLVDEALSAMSGDANAALWTSEAIRASREWARGARVGSPRFGPFSFRAVARTRATRDVIRPTRSREVPAGRCHDDESNKALPP